MTHSAEGMISDLFAGLKFSSRVIQRAPLAAAAIVLTLAFGIGANTLMFDVVDRLLLAPPPGVRRAEELFRVAFVDRQGAAFDASYPRYADLRDGASDFQDIVAMATMDLALGRGEMSRRVHAGLVTPTYFPALEVAPVLGRFFVSGEDRIPKGDAVAVLSYSLWKSAYGGSAGVLGELIELDGRPFQVVGVAPSSFGGIESQRTDIWIPISAGAASRSGPQWYADQRSDWYQVLVRKRASLPTEAAQKELTVVDHRGFRLRPWLDPHARVTLVPISGMRLPDGSPSIRGRIAIWLFGISLAVLLISGANVANVIMLRGLQRRRELAIRLALGASRARIIRLLAAESLVLTFLGWAAGAFTAITGAAILRHTLLSDIAWGSQVIGRHAQIYAGVSAIAAALLISTVPLLKLSLPEADTTLRVNVYRGGPEGTRLRSLLLAAQLVLVTGLLVTGGLLVASLRRIETIDVGFDPRHVLIATVQSSSEESGRVGEILTSALETVRAYPGVRTASLALSAPFTFNVSKSVRSQGSNGLTETKPIAALGNGVSDSFFETLGIRVDQGRGILATDGPGRQHVVVVSRALAERLWPDQEAVGRCLLIGTDTTCSMVVGVATNTRVRELREVQEPQYYVSLLQRPDLFPALTLLVRTTQDPAPLAASVRRAILSVDPSLLAVDVRSMEQQMTPLVQPWRLSSLIFAILGPLALLVAGIGVYGTMAFVARNRSDEFAVRAAFGATPKALTWLVLRESLKVAVIGIALGLAVAMAIGREVQPLLFQVSAYEPLVYLAATVTILLATVAASLAPVRRAAATDPAEILRAVV